MSVHEKFPLVRFYPAEICENKDWHVKFYAWNPFTSCMARVRVKVNRVKSVPNPEAYDFKKVLEWE